ACWPHQPILASSASSTHSCVDCFIWAMEMVCSQRPALRLGATSGLADSVVEAGAWTAGASAEGAAGAWAAGSAGFLLQAQSAAREAAATTRPGRKVMAGSPLFPVRRGV